MERVASWAPTIVAVIACLGLIWRIETRISGVELRLGNRITELESCISGVETRLGQRFARIEGLLEGSLLQAVIQGEEKTA